MYVGQDNVQHGCTLQVVVMYIHTPVQYGIIICTYIHSRIFNLLNKCKVTSRREGKKLGILSTACPTICNVMCDSSMESFQVPTDDKYKEGVGGEGFF